MTRPGHPHDPPESMPLGTHTLPYVAQSVRAVLRHIVAQQLKVPSHICHELETLAEFTTDAAKRGQEVTILAETAKRLHDPPMKAITFDQASRVLNVSARTVARLVDNSELPAVTIGNRSRRIRVADLDAYLAELAAAGGASTSGATP